MEVVIFLEHAFTFEEKTLAGKIAFVL